MSRRDGWVLALGALVLVALMATIRVAPGADWYRLP